ncbi:hypothetical protein AMK26_17995 [Streptomyces sp. CB03234]|uniref:DUF6332 family protein n=1 Tax=Streptomyces sp. (strain CB03234) TaxID=1703937 RepID=UPI000939CCE4|nr:DUF6332 family protein [Streptomyces sp. CB03234]OKK03407.1 hypothetical protein AMK26_17995 [Streptomyces sp. CB03234]
MGNRTQAQRDAITVEIGYALVTGALLAVGLFVLCAAPVPVLDLEGGAARGVLTVAATAAGLGFLTRVARVLWRFGAGAAAGRPGGPGRTGPDA